MSQRFLQCIKHNRLEMSIAYIVLGSTDHRLKREGIGNITCYACWPETIRVMDFFLFLIASNQRSEVTAIVLVFLVNSLLSSSLSLVYNVIRA